MLIDTHCHLVTQKYLESELEEIIARAEGAGVTRMIAIGTDLEDSRRNTDLAEQFESVYATVGIHPTDVLDLPTSDSWLQELSALLDHPKVVAIGEIGLDYYHPPRQGTAEAYHARQAEVFKAQMELAVEKGYNIVVHTRDSYDDAVAMLAPFDGKLQAVLHCFSGSAEQAESLWQRGHLVSFTGIATFKNAREVQECAQSVAPGSFMVETDAPFLAPVPFRGKRCEPAYTRHTAEHIANLRGITLEELAAETSATARQFFQGLD